MTSINWKNILGKSEKIAWGLLFFSLPITSFPYFPAEFGGKTLVRPFAAYPLVFLLLAVTIPRLIKRQLPRTFLPLLAFIFLAGISSLLAMATSTEGLLGVSVASRTIRNLATLALGVAFYITIVMLINNWDDLKFSIRWMVAGFTAALLWGSAQALYILHYNSNYFQLLNQVQSLVSTRKLFPDRISGLTYEPKWFAEQICFLLLPWLLASILSKRSLFAWRYKWISVEWILSAWASVVLVFTFSRTGLIIAIGLSVLSFIIYRAYALTPNTKPGLAKPGSKRRLVFETGVLLTSLLTILFIVGSQNPYFSRLWRYWTEDKARNRTYLEYIAFEQRFVYWETAFQIFEEQPVLGVGLGNYAFHFKDALPDRFYRMPEIVRQITPTEGRDRLITSKNLLARLLAETGILGTATFIAFAIGVLGCALRLFLSPNPEQKSFGLGSILSMAVFGVVIFSFDSFAIPNMWVSFGLITAAAYLPMATEKPLVTE